MSKGHYWALGVSLIAASLVYAMAANVEETKSAVEVGMTNDLAFQPRTVQIRVGETVTWRNTSALVHTVTADPALAQRADDVELPQGAQRFNSGSIAPGQSYSHTFSVPGTYRYFCIPHELQGMTGTVEVLPRSGGR